MASTTSTGDSTDTAVSKAADITDRLTQMADRSSLMALDATLRAAHDNGVKSLVGIGNFSAAAEVRAMARQMLQATRDFRAALHEAAE
ncbi:hypothetical protein [Azospirillum doebereinerae]|uniref:Methyl-accepting transducer domain-containing protein n=1 Tax=Azospirillum doebereinerae TaxID=92933 RepID=A0A433J2J5_9PROT|nr:hypothetical protein [Azospirillum doebereinerae]MCG5243042.1 hypothetical protein [Azospirillum doebereinerae]RUQ65893.1 hypothetical protein EJ913_24785 [Azospirillum doebereinerae]